MKQFFDVLKGCSLFADIADEDMSILLPCVGAQVRSYERKQCILSQGEPARWIGIVLSGTVQMVQVDYFGNRTILGAAGVSDLFAESFACARMERMEVDVVAADTVQVLLLDSRRILETCSNACTFHRKLVYNLMRIMAQKNIAFQQKIQVTSKRTTREKLLAYLQMQAKKNGSVSFHIPFNRQELADYLEVERSGLSAEIGKLCRAGVIRNRRGYFELLQWAQESES